MNFEDLDVWQRSVELSADIYKRMQGLKDYGFKDQITRSGLSIPSNISEGFERDSDRDCVKFLLYAKGSCGELRTQVIIGMKVGYIPCEAGEAWKKESLEISRMLGGLIRSKRAYIERKSSKKV